MSKSNNTGLKRKLADEPSTCWLSVSDEVLSGDIDAYFSNIVEQIQNGNHVELRRRNIPLERMKEKHIAASDRHRKEQIKNINQMYEYEIEDARAQYQRAYSELQEQLVADVMEECNKLKNLQKKIQSESHKSEKLHHARSLRSSYGESVLDVNSNSKSKSKRKAKEPILQLNEVIPESSCRADLLEIVRDLQEQAKALNKTSAKRSIGVLEDNSGFSIDETMFHIGDNLKVFSHSCHELYIGVLTMVSHRDFIIRTGTGTRISFHLTHAENGRLDISH